MAAPALKLRQLATLFWYDGPQAVTLVDESLTRTFLGLAVPCRDDQWHFVVIELSAEAKAKANQLGLSPKDNESLLDAPLREWFTSATNAWLYDASQGETELSYIPAVPVPLPLPEMYLPGP